MAARIDASTVFSDLSWLWAEQDRARADRIGVTARRVVGALRSGGDVLDVACGTGSLLARVRAEARDAGKDVGALVGVDIAPGMVRLANARRDIAGVRGDAEALPFPDQSFDVVIASHALQFVRDPVRAVRELCRVALPGGTVIIELSTRAARSESRRLAQRLPRSSLLRRYLELPRTYRTASVFNELERQRCDVRVINVGRDADEHRRFLARIARWSGTTADLRVARHIDRMQWPNSDSVVAVARMPGPRIGSMPVHVTGLAGWTAERVRELLDDLPKARGYHVVVKPLRWRTRPHVQAFCEFYRHRITIQVPLPFRPFHEDVPYRAERVGAKGFRFRWFTRRLRFERPDELIRYLYLHEYYHWYLREVVGRQTAAAETACDRFALSRL